MADRTVVYRLTANITGLKAQMAQASASVRKAGDDMTAAGKSGDKFRKGLDTVGRTAGKVGLAAAAGLGVTVLAAANFDKAMSAVQAATHESSSNMDLLRAAAIKAGADTKYSASEAAQGIEELAKAGVSTKDILAGGLSGSLNLAAAGEIEVGEAAETAASAMTQFKLKGDQVNHVADLLSAGAGKAQGSVHDLGMALNQSGLVASQTGLSIEETTGTLAAFASAGLTGSDAGTSFKQMLLSLTPSSAKAKNLMDELGISAYDAQGNFIGMAAFADNLKSSLAGMSQEQQNATLKTIFGSDAVRAASIIYQDGGKGIQSWIDKTNDAGYAAETAATRMDNLAGDLEQFKGSLETALIGQGEGAQAPLRSLVQNLTDVVNAYNSLPAAAKSGINGVLGATALLGGGLYAFSKVVTGVSNMRTAFDNLSTSAPRAARGLGAVGRAGASLGAVVITANALNEAIQAIADTKIDASTLNRDLTSLADGRITDNLGNLSQTFEDIQQTSARFNPLSHLPLVNWDPQGYYAAKDAIESLDESLAAMAEGGATKEAAAAFERLGATAREAGVSQEKLNDLFPQYETALFNAGETSNFGVKIFEAVGGALDKVAKHSGQTADQQQRLATKQRQVTAAMKEQRQAVADASQQWLGLGDGLNKAKVSLDTWIKHFAKQADALKNFRINAQQAAKKGLDEGLIASLHAAGPEGALRMKQLADATKEQIARANEGFRSGKREADNLNAAINKITSPKPVPVSVETDQAMSLLQRLQDFTFRDKYIRVHTVRSGGGEPDFQHGTGFDSGGYTGNYPASEPVGVVHGREFVMDAVSTARIGVANLYALQRQYRGYAQGGFVAQTAQPVGAASGPALRIDLGSVQLVGTLHSAQGPIDVQGVAQAVTRSDRAYQRSISPRPTRRGRG